MTQTKKRFLSILLLLLLGTGIVCWINRKGIESRFAFWRDFEFIAVNEQGHKEYLHKASGIVMVLIPGGEFWMGSPEEEEGRGDDEYRHRVSLSSFLIAKYEVSQSVWTKVMGDNPANFKDPDKPVESISWWEVYGDVKSFCKKMNLTLPTEAQWEYACRAESQTPYYFNPGQIKYHEGGGPELFHHSLDRKNFKESTVKVDSFDPNSFGLFNMHGNVSEWCLDIYLQYYYNEKEARNGDLPCIEESFNLRVYRGGGHASALSECRSASRHSGFEKDFSATDIGFRPVYVMGLRSE